MSNGHARLEESAASSTMDLGHGAVVWVVARVVSHERLGAALTFVSGIRHQTRPSTEWHSIESAVDVLLRIASAA